MKSKISLGRGFWTKLAIVLMIAALSISVFAGCNDDTGANQSTEQSTKSAQLTNVTFTDATYTYDGTAKTVQVAGVPQGATVTYSPTNTYTDAGEYTVTAKVKLDEEEKTLSAKLKINKASFADKIRFEDKTFSYDGQAYWLEIEVDGGLPEGITVSYEGDGATEAGTYTVTAKFSGENKNYLTPANMTANMTITHDGAYHNVEFAVDGNTVSSLVVKDGETLSETQFPLLAGRTGYTAAWSYDGAAVTSDLKVNAVYTPIDYSVVYELNGGTNAATNPATYTIADAVTFAAATRNGYDFGGWYKDAACTQSATGITAGSTGKVTVYAKWTAKAYTLTYKLNGGTNAATNPATYTIEQTVTFDNPIRAGYTFEGWYSDSAMTAAADVISSGTTGDMTVYAKWSLVEYTITYYLGNGTNAATNPATYTVESATITFADATRGGCDFKGWFSDSALRNAVTSIPAGSTGDVKVYAGWDLITYTLTLDFNDGVSGIATTFYNVESPATTLPVVERGGYEFKGWFDEDENLMTEVEQGHYGNVSLKVTWEIIDYDITYNANGGEFEDGYPEFVTYNAETDTTDLALPVRPGYTFVGWDNGSSVFTTIENGSYGTQNLVAVWSVNSYTANFYADGALIATFRFTVEDEQLPGSVAVPEKAGYTAAWEEYSIVPQDITVNAVYTGIEYTATFKNEANETVGTVTYTLDDAELEEPEVPAKVGYTVTWEEYEIVVGGITVNAVYTTDVYTITYTDEKNAANDNPTEYTVETATFALGNLSGVPGYKFVGWYDGDDKVTEITLGSIGDRQFTAKWDTSAFAITYVLNGGENADANVDGYDVGDDDITLADPTREGYTFGGWYADEAMIGEIVTVIPAAGACDVTLYAKWYGNVYVARYFIEDVLYAEVEFTLEDEYIGGWANVDLIPEKTGYTASWEEYEIVPQDIIINAVYTPIVYTITYTLGDNATNAATNPESYTIETATFTFDKAARPGYKFVGWYDSQETEVTGIDLGSYGEVTLTAKWSEITYTVVFIADELIYDTSTYTYADPTFNTPSTVPEKAGFTAAWEDFEPIFDETETHVVKAVYTPVTYTITYGNMDDATNAETNPATYTVVTPTFSFAAPTKDGYTFGGWYSTETPGETDEPVTKINRGSYGDVTIYAKWTATGFTITYGNMTGATNAQGNPATYTIESAAITFADPTKTGYTFGGWYSVETPTDTDEPVTGIEAGSTGNVTIYANWTAITYTITYGNMDGATNAEGNPATYTIESAAITFAAPTKTGYTFNGWFTTATPGETDEPVTTIATGSNGNKTFYAKWTATTYTITYGNMTGATNAQANPATYTIESAAITFADPTKTGYTFGGWYSVETPTETDEPVTGIEAGSTENVTVYAKWTATTYTITYGNMDGATNADGNPATYTIEDETITFADPTKTGYTFNGWFTTATPGETDEPVTTIATGSNGNKTFYAKWTIIEYAITYELGGGTNAQANPAKYTVLSTITLAAPTRTGYNFVGWYLVEQPTAEDTAVTTVDVTTLDAITYYAKWQPVVYTITYVNMDGATNADGNPATYTIEDATITFAVPTKTGCTFKGWFADELFTEEFASIATGSYGNKTVYAKWINTVYMITYELGGGTNNEANPYMYTADSTITLEPATREGYDFVGWYFVPNPTEEDEAVTTVDVTVFTPLQFYAVWAPKTYTITYGNMTNATNAETNPATYTPDSATITLAAPTKEGCDFVGWYLVANPGETDEPVTTIESGSVGNKTFYAKWTFSTYTITYELDGGTNNANNPATFNVDSDITFQPATKTGYTFNGWYTTATPSDTDTAVTGIAVGTMGNKTFYAVWTPVTYTVTYGNMTGATNAEGNPATYTIEDETITFAAPTKTGYDFGGWFTTATPGETDTAVTTIEAGSNGNKTFYAKWTAITYTVTYGNMTGATNAQANPATYTIESQTITFATPTKTGYTFGGWYAVENPGAEDEAVTTIEAGSTENVTVYATWTATTYTITYGNMTGATNAEGNPATYTIEDETITFADPTKTGYDFGGWFTTATPGETDEPVTTIEAGSTGNVTVYATWTATTYTVTYGNMTGATNAQANPATYTIESQTITFATPTKTGYTFGGWYAAENPGAEDEAVTTIEAGSTGNVTVYATWTATTYTITYGNMTGATNAEGNPATYTIEDETITFADPTKTGYDFGGWFTTATPGETDTAVTTIATGSNGNKTFYAKWTAITYTITYVVGAGATNAQANPSTYTIESQTITLAAPTKTGYTFGGWYTTATPEETDEAVTTIATGSTGNVTFYATWSLTTYTITYGNMTNATNAEGNPTTYTINSETITLGAPTKDTCDFNGWYLVANPGETDEPVTTIAAGSTGNKTFYAKWTFTNYTITYELDGGTNNANNPATFNVDTNVTFQAPTKTGYTFGGWYTTATPEETDEAVTGIATGTTGDKTFYAIWTPTEYTITYGNMTGATNAEGNPATYTIEDETITLAAPTKTGYTFGGWYTIENPTEAVTTIATGSTGDKIFYAIWSAVTYTITYANIDDATNAQGNPATYTIESAAITLAAPTKTGYTFGGWYTTATPEETDEAVTGIVTGTTGDKTFYAIWTPTEYTITYNNMNGATNPESNPATYTIETPSFTFASATREGYEIVGWYTDEQLTQAITGIEVGSTGNVTVYAKWDIRNYNITYVLNGGDEQTFVSAATYNIESDLVIFGIPQREGYAFLGWYTSADFSEASRVIGVKPSSTGDVTAYAKWMVGTLTVDVSAISWFANDGAVIGVYVWFSDNTDASDWPGVAMTYDQTNGVYTFTMPTEKAIEGIIITRVNPATGTTWNQTYDITDLPEDGKITLTEDDIMD